MVSHSLVLLGCIAGVQSSRSLTQERICWIRLPSGKEKCKNQELVENAQPNYTHIWFRGEYRGEHEDEQKGINEDCGTNDAEYICTIHPPDFATPTNPELGLDLGPGAKCTHDGLGDGNVGSGKCGDGLECEVEDPAKSRLGKCSPKRLCLVKMPSGCNGQLRQTKNPLDWFVDDRRAGQQKFNKYCRRADAEYWCPEIFLGHSCGWRLNGQFLGECPADLVCTADDEIPDADSRCRQKELLPGEDCTRDGDGKCGHGLKCDASVEFTQVSGTCQPIIEPNCVKWFNGCHTCLVTDGKADCNCGKVPCCGGEKGLKRYCSEFAGRTTANPNDKVIFPNE